MKNYVLMISNNVFPSQVFKHSQIKMETQNESSVCINNITDI